MRFIWEASLATKTRCDRLLPANSKAIQKAVKASIGDKIIEYRIDGARGLVQHVLPSGTATWYFQTMLRSENDGSAASTRSGGSMRSHWRTRLARRSGGAHGWARDLLRADGMGDKVGGLDRVVTLDDLLVGEAK